MASRHQTVKSDTKVYQVAEASVQYDNANKMYLSVKSLFLQGFQELNFCHCSVEEEIITVLEVDYRFPKQMLNS